MTNNNSGVNGRLQEWMNKSGNGSTGEETNKASNNENREYRRLYSEYLQRGFNQAAAQRAAANDQRAQREKAIREHEEQHRKAVHDAMVFNTQRENDMFRPEDERDYQRMSTKRRLLAQASGYRGTKPVDETEAETDFEKVEKRKAKKRREHAEQQKHANEIYNRLWEGRDSNED